MCQLVSLELEKVLRAVVASVRAAPDCKKSEPSHDRVSSSGTGVFKTKLKVCQKTVLLALPLSVFLRLVGSDAQT